MIPESDAEDSDILESSVNSKSTVRSTDSNFNKTLEHDKHDKPRPSLEATGDAEEALVDEDDDGSFYQPVRRAKPAILSDSEDDVSESPSGRSGDVSDQAIAKQDHGDFNDSSINLATPAVKAKGKRRAAIVYSDSESEDGEESPEQEPEVIDVLDSSAAPSEQDDDDDYEEEDGQASDSDEDFVPARNRDDTSEIDEQDEGSFHTPAETTPEQNPSAVKNNVIDVASDDEVDGAKAMPEIPLPKHFTAQEIDDLKKQLKLQQHRVANQEALIRENARQMIDGGKGAREQLAKMQERQSALLARLLYAQELGASAPFKPVVPKESPKTPPTKEQKEEPDVVEINDDEDDITNQQTQKTFSPVDVANLEAELAKQRRVVETNTKLLNKSRATLPDNGARLKEFIEKARARETTLTAELLHARKNLSPNAVNLIAENELRLDTLHRRVRYFLTVSYNFNVSFFQL